MPIRFHQVFRALSPLASGHSAAGALASGLFFAGLIGPCLAGLGTRAAAERPPEAPPAKNWVLPLFTKEGYHSMTLRGAEESQSVPDRIDAKDLTITVFTGGAHARVETTLLSQTASFFPSLRTASGPDFVRMIRDDVEVTGNDWRYLYNEKKVSINRNARVVFRAPLPDILK